MTRYFVVFNIFIINITIFGIYFSETLDEHNPWFCPKCECNQCATKTLTVHRYPKFLIVYLKRYVKFVIFTKVQYIYIDKLKISTFKIFTIKDSLNIN